MRLLIALGSVALLANAASFDVASLKRSAEQKGIDYRGRVVVGVNRLSGRNVTLQDMIAVAYRVQLSQVVSGLKWVGSDEFDIEARAEASQSELREMLQALLVERFHLVLKRDEREARVQALVVDKGGLKSSSGVSAQGFHFHGTMQQFADLLAIQATIPAAVDPTRPATASAVPMHVIDATGLEGVQDLTVELKPELGTDRLTEWQRALREQAGLRMESRKAKIEVLVVTGADRVPAGN